VHSCALPVMQQVMSDIRRQVNFIGNKDPSQLI
jgi:hypothetical protein